MDDIKVLYPSDPDLSTEALVEAVNDLLSINSVARPFVREQGDWRFVDELGGDGFFPDYINLVLVFVSANVLTEFVKSFAGKAGSILAERLFERIEKGKNDCESDLDQATHEQKLADKSKDNEYDMMYSFYCHIEEENKTRHSVFHYRAESYGNPDHRQVNSPERLKQVINNELDKLARGLGSDRWDQ